MTVQEVCRSVQLKTEIYVSVIFVLISGSYILYKHGFEKMVDTLFFWMFPASIMLFLTLLIVVIIDRIYNKNRPNL